MSPAPCDYCPRAEVVHQEQNASMFMLCVVKVPGKTPVIIATPTFCVDPNEHGAPDVPLARLTDAIRKCGHDLANEMARKLGVAETTQKTVWGDVAYASDHQECASHSGDH